VRLAFVTPRYGAELTTGAEHACRLLAEQVSDRHDIDVLTTCARDARTWKNEYPEGPDRVRGVLVRHFAVTQSHDRGAFRQLTEQIGGSARSRSEELEWVRRLGPWSPSLLEYLKRQGRGYDALVFFSLWHPTTVHGIAVAPERSILFPHLRLEPALRFGLWNELFASVRAVGYLSAAERRLARAFLHAYPPVEEIVGIGIDTAPQQAYPRHQQDPADSMPVDEEAGQQTESPEETDPLMGRGVPFRRRHRLYGQFALYGGRVDCDNGFEEMFEYFDTYARSDGDSSLVLMGVKLMKVPEEPFVRLAGVLPDRERMIAYEAADVTLVPSSDDLLSQSLLESLAVGTPVLASARNEASVEHIRRSNGGLYYANREEFVEALRLLMTNTRLRERLGENGRQYIKQQHRWDAVLGRFERLVTKARAR
jgi:glycosyltransferase involved in cell wall biosynthesis